MKVLRIALGVVVGAYGLYCLFPLLSNAAYKLGYLHRLTGDAARVVPLWEATPWWQLAVWLAVLILFAVAGWRLIRGRSAFRLYAVTIVLDAALWWVFQSSAAYRQVFTQAELQLDYYSLGAMLLVGGLIWRVERTPGQTAAA